MKFEMSYAKLDIKPYKYIDICSSEVINSPKYSYLYIRK